MAILTWACKDMQVLLEVAQCVRLQPCSSICKGNLSALETLPISCEKWNKKQKEKDHTYTENQNINNANKFSCANLFKSFMLPNFEALDIGISLTRSACTSHHLFKKSGGLTWVVGHWSKVMQCMRQISTSWFWPPGSEQHIRSNVSNEGTH